MTFTAYLMLGLSEPMAIAAEADVSALFQALREKPIDRWECALYYEDEDNGARLRFAVDHERGVGYIEYRGYDSFITEGTNTDPGEIAYFDGVEHAHDVPHTAEIPAADVQRGVLEFVMNQGALPKSVPWADEAPV